MTSDLPILKHRLEILYCLERYNTLIINSETGSGKSTQTPQILVKSGYASEEGLCIAISQPRSVAVKQLAKRVALELGVTVGQYVGYSVRFDECFTFGTTKIKFMTDGMLVQEFMVDPLLAQYSVVVVDDCHERTVYTDVLLGLLKKIQLVRNELRVIISSATLDSTEMYSYFHSSKRPARVLSLTGRIHPVQTKYLGHPSSDYLQTILQTILDIHINQPQGIHILVFLPGRLAIEKLYHILSLEATTITVLPFFSGQTEEDQNKVFSPSTRRKCILSTNIAESSLTIEGVGYVIDSGLVRVNWFDPASRTQTLSLTYESKASAIQRCGRAGRDGPGTCFRVYTLQNFEDFDDTIVPEIARTDLTGVVLQMSSLYIQDIPSFDLITPLPRPNLLIALDKLNICGAVDECGIITKYGSLLCEFPINPRLANMLIHSCGLGCSDEIVSIVAILSVGRIINQPRGPSAKRVAQESLQNFASREGDLITMLNIFNAFISSRKNQQWCRQRYFNFQALSQTLSIRKALLRSMKRYNLEVCSCDNVETVQRAILYGFSENVAKLNRDLTYSQIGSPSSRLYPHPSSCLSDIFPAWIVYTDILTTSQMFMTNLTLVKPAWLTQDLSHIYSFQLNT